MAAWVQRRDGAMPATAAALLRMEVSVWDGRQAKRAGRPSGLGGGVGLGWPPGQGRKVAGPVEEGRGGMRGSSRKGGPGRLGRTGQKGGSIWVRFQVGFVQQDLGRFLNNSRLFSMV
jgi:hypothetical protein